MNFDIKNYKEKFTEGRELLNFLVVLCIFIFAVYPFVNNDSWGMFFINSVLSLLIVLAAISIGVFNDKKWSLLILTITSISSNFAVIFTDEPPVLLIHIILKIIFLFIIGFMILKRILTDGKVSVYSIAGAITVYLLSGLIWAYSYELIYKISNDSFLLSSSLVGKKNLTWNFVYYSYNRMTTLGYSDISPVSHLAMSLATLEGLFGQLFPIVLISRFVSGSSNKD